MNRRAFLKGLVAIGVGINIPVQLVSTRVMSIEDAFVEQYRITINILAYQRTSRLRNLIQ